MTELKPCPFCGGEVEMDDSEMFTCLDCGLIARFPNSPKQIKNAANGLLINNYDTEWHVEHWNTRAEKTCRGIFKGRHYGYDCILDCSECGKQLTYIWKGVVVPNYCPNCGAKVESD